MSKFELFSTRTEVNLGAKHQCMYLVKLLIAKIHRLPVLLAHLHPILHYRILLCGYMLHSYTVALMI